jgi:hypothetical protein
MATVQYDLTVSDSATGPLRDAAAAAVAAADAQDRVAQAEREAATDTRRLADEQRAEAEAARAQRIAADDAAAAQRRLHDVVLSVASAEERARVIHERRRAEIVRLTQVSGDASIGAQALAANDKVLADTLAGEATRAAKTAEAAQVKLRDVILSTASAEDRAREAHQRAAAEIRRLGEASGDAAAMTAALASNDKALAADLDRASAAQSRAAAAAMGTAGGMQAAARSTGGLGAALRAIGQQMPDVIGQLQLGANPMTILTQQGGQVIEVLSYTGGGGLGATLSALLPVVVAVAAGIGGLVLAVKSFNGELDGGTAALDEANTRTRMLATTHERLRAMLEDTRDTMRALKVVTGEMSEEQARLAGASEDALGRWRSAMKDTRAELAALRRDQSSVSTQIVDGMRAMIEAVDEFAGFDPSADLAAFDYFFTTGDEIKGRIAALSGEVDKSVGALKGNADAHKGLVKAAGEADKARDRGAAAAKRATEAEREHERALMAARAAMTAASEAAAALLRGPLSERDRLLGAADDLYAIAEASGTTARQASVLEGQIEALLARVAELDAAPEIELRLQVTAAVDALTREIDAAIATGVVAGAHAAAQQIEMQRLSLADALRKVGTVGQGRGVQALGSAMVEQGVARAVSGGGGARMAGVGSALMMAGGTAGAAVAAVQVVAGLEDMEAGIRETSSAALQNLKRLDKLLPGIIEALGNAAGQIIVSLPEILVGLVTGIVQGLVMLGQDLLRGLVDLGRAIVAAVLPGRQRGETKDTDEKVMRGIGAVAGAVFGFAVAGPVGAVAGAAAGAAAASKMQDIADRIDSVARTTRSTEARSFTTFGPAGPMAQGGAQAPAASHGAGVAVVVNARPMLAIDRQGGRQLSGAIAETVGRQKFTTAAPGRRTR